MEENRWRFHAASLELLFKKGGYSAFLTLSFPNTRGAGSIPVGTMERVDKFFRKTSKALGVGVVAAGLIILPFSGNMHAHILGGASNGQTLPPRVLNVASRAWPHNSKVIPIYDLEHLSGYLATQKHIFHCSDAELYYFVG